MSLFHPKIRLPLWAAVAILAAAYLVRSVARGLDFRPDLPSDAVVLVLFLALVAAVYLSRRLRATEKVDDTLPEKVEDEDERPGQERE